MAETAWTAWYKDVLTHVPGCPRTLATEAIRAAAISFFGEAKTYLLESDPINVVAGTKEYAFAKAGYNVEPVTIWDALYNEGSLELLTRAKLKERFTNWSILEGTPLHAVELTPGSVRLVPFPNASLAGGLVLWAYVRPTMDSAGLEEAWAERYFRQIANGAKAKLLYTKGEPYYDPGLGKSFHDRFAQDIADANYAAETGGVDEQLEGEGEFY